MADPKSNNSEKVILLFDGVCHACNAVVNFILKVDVQARFVFVPLQSERGEELLRQAGLTPGALDTVVLIENGKAYKASKAAFAICRILGGKMQLLLVFSILPLWLTDWGYYLFAKYRYRLFGKEEFCRIATPEERGRFLS
jgi:predicted DCC family thiol-disulfide oxidoreductase YuxK